MANRETYLAEVVDNADPEERGRIRVKCPALLGGDSADLPVWVEPALAWGAFLVPEPGEMVEIEASSDDWYGDSFGQASLEEPGATWKGVRYYGATGDERDASVAPTPIHPDFTAVNYGRRRGFATPAGHVLLFDDTPGQEMVRLSWKAEGADADTSFIQIDASGSVRIQTAGGKSVATLGADGTVRIEASGAIDVDASGKVDVVAGGAATLKAPSIALDANAVNVGSGADSPIPRGTELDAFLTQLTGWLTTLTLPVSGAAAGPPAVPPPTVPPTLNSSTHKVK